MLQFGYMHERIQLFILTIFYNPVIFRRIIPASSGKPVAEQKKKILQTTSNKYYVMESTILHFF